MTLIKTICPYCGVGCSFFFCKEKNKITGIIPDKNDPVSEGKPCIKGLTSHEIIYAKERLTKPLIRRNGKLQQVTWDKVYDYIYHNLKSIKPDEIAFYASSPASNEAAYLFQRFAREYFKTENIDSCARLCHATTCYSFYNAFGIRKMFSKFDDYKHADCIMIIGSNPKITYPAVFNKILYAKSNGAKLICINDWRDETCQHADLFVKIIDGTDIVFLNTILNLLVKKGATAVNVPADVKNVIKNYTVNRCIKECKCTKGDIVSVVSSLADSKCFVLGYGMELTQHTYGTQNVFAAINLVLAKNSNIIPMRGKANIQGVGDMGCLPRAVGRGAEGKTFVNSIFFEKVKVLYIMHSNPAQSLPDLTVAHKNMRKMFVILQATYPNKTMEFASVVLPASSWAETQGTFTNAESRIRFFDKALEPYAETKQDWVIINELAQRFGLKWNYKNELKILQEIKEKIPCYAEIDLQKLKAQGQFVKKKIRFRHFFPVEFSGLEERTSKKFPLVLMTTRLSYHFCTDDHIKRSKTIKKLLPIPYPYCIISKEDAKILRIKNNNLIEITSHVGRAGKVRLRAIINENVPKGLVIAPFHFEDAPINKVIPLEFSPFVEEPNLKRIAVQIKKL